MALVQSAPQRYEDAILRRHLPRWRACGQPDAWSQYRLGLIKTLPWFTAIEGGICETVTEKKHWRHTEIKYLTGLLISGHPGINSYLDAEIIITSLSTPVPFDQPALTSTARRRLASLKATFAEKRLVGCLVTQKATEDRSRSTNKKGPKSKWTKTASRPFFCCPMPRNEGAWVLGWYVITDYWQARVKNGVTTMFRLERCNLQDKAWFASAHPSHTPPPLSARDFVTKAVQEKCTTCDKYSPRMYEEHFLCRHEDCADFWTHNGEVSIDPLTYTKKYLQQREPRPRDGGFKPYGAYKGTAICPQMPEIADVFTTWWSDKYQRHQNNPLTTENWQERMSSLRRGMWCPQCGMLNPRKHWDKWACANTNCNYSKVGYPKISTANELTSIYKKSLPNFSALPFFERTDDADGYFKHNYNLGAGCGVAVLVPKPGTNQRPQGADWLLAELQRDASQGVVDLQRQLTAGTMPGLYTSHFLHNYGREYYLTVDIQQQTSMENAPQVIRVARDAANSLCRQYQQNSTSNDEDFNECYLAAYFKDDAMGWHADGEGGLGSVIAGWTIGGEGEMKIAPSDEQYWGRVAGKGKVIADDPLLAGVLNLEERTKLKNELDQQLAAITGDSRTDTLKKTAFRAEYEKKFLELMDEQKKTNKEKPKRLLTLPLTHGSMVVMHGVKFQEYFRHAVEVSGPLRFALTFRCIHDEHSKLATKSARDLGVYPHTRDNTHLDDFDDDAEDCEEQMDAGLPPFQEPQAADDAPQDSGPGSTKEVEVEEEEEETSTKKATSRSSKGESSGTRGTKRKKEDSSDGEPAKKPAPKKPKAPKAPKAGCKDPKGKGKGKRDPDDDSDDDVMSMDLPIRSSKSKFVGLKGGSSAAPSTMEATGEKKGKGDAVGKKVYATRNKKQG